MAINFGILQPIDIAGKLAAGQQEAQRNQLAQQQMQTGALQQEKAQLELADFKRRQTALDTFVQQAKQNGKTGSEEDLANNYYDYALNTGDPQHILHAQELLMGVNERKAYLASKQPPKISPVAPAPNAMGSGTFGMDQNVPMYSQPNALAVSTPIRPQTPVAATTNQLAPAPVAPVAPVNQLGMSPAEIQAKINDLTIRYPHGTAKGEIAMLTKQLEESMKPHVVAPGGTVFMGGKSIFTAPKEVTESEFERNLAKSGLPEDQKMALRVARARKEATHAPPISVSYGQEKAEAVDYGKLLVKGYEGIQAASNLAQKSLPAIESNLAILDKGFDTGFATETKAAGAKVLGALGVKDAEKYATDAQSFLANANAAVLQRQLEQKGPQTESDAQRISATGAQLGNTKDANRFVLNVAKAQLQRDIDQRKFYADWRATHKTFEGADDAWVSGPGSKSLFDSPTLKKYAPPVNATPAPVKDSRPPLADIFKSR
jgi:hypothetical protein